MQFPAVNPPPPESGVVPCMFCGEATTTGRGYEQVVGFRKRRSEGGANQIIQAKATERWACADCVDKMRAGLHPLQPSLTL
jgi:hypothetical protein